MPPRRIRLRGEAPRIEPPGPHPLDFFGLLKWLDGRPLLDTIEPYRRETFTQVLYTFDDAGRPRYNFALCGRAKKNFKTTDLILASFYRLLVWRSAAGNDCFILANDEEQAGDGLSLAKKLVAVNPILAHELVVTAKSITRADGKGAMTILPAGDVAGAHGKTYLFCGFDEIHAYKNHDLFEALAPDPTRPDVLTWITSYAGIRHAPGIPLYDFLQAGKRGDDPRMYFSWYGGDFTTDPTLQDPLISAEDRANPSKGSWSEATGYLAQQRRRLPAHKFRRLHLNLPGAPDGAAFSGEHVMAAIVDGRRSIPPEPQHRYHAFVDMSGGSNDDAVLGIAHREGRQVILDALVPQSGAPPFNPRHAVTKFAELAKTYRCTQIVGDAYAGETFRRDFESHGIRYQISGKTKSEIYEDFEPILTASEVVLLDVPKLQEQLLTLVWRGTRIDHQSGDHDDHANAACGAVLLADGGMPALLEHAMGAAAAMARPKPDEPLLRLKRPAGSSVNVIMPLSGIAPVGVDRDGCITLRESDARGLINQGWARELEEVEP
jgi:hypothetical protein